MVSALLITADQVSVDNPETRRMQRLMGKPLTRFEILKDGSVLIEFDPHGSISIKPVWDINASVAPRTQ